MNEAMRLAGVKMRWHRLGTVYITQNCIQLGVDENVLQSICSIKAVR